MTEKKARHIYYLRGLTPGFIAFIAMFSFEASLLSISTFLLCYLWTYFLFTPGARSKYSTAKFKSSFVGLLIRLDELLRNGLPGRGERRNFAISILTPIVFILILWILSGAGEPLFALAGAVLFTVTYRYLLHSIASANFEVSLESDSTHSPAENASEPTHDLQSHQKDNDSNS